MSPKLVKDEELTETIKKLVSFIEKFYGSRHSFKLLKYFLEHKLARENDSFNIYELSFNIPPSAVLRRQDLELIYQHTDQVTEEESKEGMDIILKNEILVCDPESQIIRLNRPLEDISNIYLKEEKEKLIITDEKKEADIILLLILNTKSPDRESIISGISGVVDTYFVRKKHIMLLKDKIR